MKVQIVGRGNAQENNDCVVRALQNATGFDYASVHAWAAQLGRSFGRGTKWHVVCALFDKLGPRGVCQVNLDQFVTDHPSGTWVVGIRGHVFVLKDGVILDLGIPSPRSVVRWFWHVTNEVKLPKSVPVWEKDATDKIPAHLRAILAGKVKPIATLETA
jgi:hypothetical protein